MKNKTNEDLYFDYYDDQKINNKTNTTKTSNENSNKGYGYVSFYLKLIFFNFNIFMQCTLHTCCYFCIVYTKYSC